jgi:hypothetical protein
MQIGSRGLQMTTSLNALVANEHVADLQRAGLAVRNDANYSASPKPVALRLADDHDAATLHELAELDEQPGLTGDALLALIDGEAVAAMSLEDGRVVSNPFVATSDAVALLKLRSRHLGGRGSRRERPRWRPRFA